jgi:hypothetical protein
MGDDAGISAQDASGDGANSATTVARGDFPQAYASAICDNIEPCCETVGSSYSKERCEAANTGTDLGSTVTYDGNAAALCLAALRDLVTSCAAFTNTEEYQNCGRVYAGTRGEGQPCTIPAECLLPADGSVSCVGNLCRQERAVGLGEKCADGSPDGYFDHCGPDGYCPAGVCTARLALGADCFGNDQCTTNDCGVDFECVVGPPPQGIGGPCETGSDCQDGLTCDPAMRTCALFDARFFNRLCGDQP